MVRTAGEPAGPASWQVLLIKGEKSQYSVLPRACPLHRPKTAWTAGPPSFHTLRRKNYCLTPSLAPLPAGGGKGRHRQVCALPEQVGISAPAQCGGVAPRRPPANTAVGEGAAAQENVLSAQVASETHGLQGTNEGSSGHAQSSTPDAARPDCARRGQQGAPQGRDAGSGAAKDCAGRGRGGGALLGELLPPPPEPRAPAVLISGAGPAASPRDPDGTDGERLSALAHPCSPRFTPSRGPCAGRSIPVSPFPPGVS